VPAILHSAKPLNNTPVVFLSSSLRSLSISIARRPRRRPSRRPHVAGPRVAPTSPARAPSPLRPPATSAAPAPSGHVPRQPTRRPCALRPRAPPAQRAATTPSAARRPHAVGPRAAAPTHCHPAPPPLSRHLRHSSAIDTVNLAPSSPLRPSPPTTVALAKVYDLIWLYAITCDRFDYYYVI
jgi:hypothetical protein